MKIELIILKSRIMKTKKLIPLISLILISFLAYPQTNPNVKVQRGYIKRNGTAVQPHFKTKSNNINKDNFSTKDNTNTFTGKAGTRAKDYSSEAQNYGKGKIIRTGPKNGQYYKSSKATKVYVPKR